MNIKILDSWLREYLKTEATPQDIAEKLSLTSVSIERLEKWKHDWLYDIEVTTNRPDLMSVVGLAREAATVLTQFGSKSEFLPPQVSLRFEEILADAKSGMHYKPAEITIINDPKLVYRICAVIMEVQVKPSPNKIKERLESSGIRSLNNIIDITNYIMRTIGHPSHVFDFDRLNTSRLIIRESQKGEVIQTLDKKTHSLPGGDIVAVDQRGRIVDLLGIMGLENSIVTNQTKRILLFINNNDPRKIRKTSMSLAIRSEAAQLNEKGIDPELAYEALVYGIKLYQDLAEGRVLSEIIDIYSQKTEPKQISISEEKINSVIGVQIPLEKSAEILSMLGFKITKKEKQLNITVPSFRMRDVNLEEDIIEEIARVYGYHNLPSTLPKIVSQEITQSIHDAFYWESRIKQALKYWGFIETYTYSMVSEDMYEGPIEDAVTLRNPLDQEHMYMRKTLVPSLLQVARENISRETLNLFEIANVYKKNVKGLPTEHRMLALIMKGPKISFYDIKGLIEQLGEDLGINFLFKSAKEGIGADVFIGNTFIGSIEELAENLMDAELDFEQVISHATLKKTYKPIAKYPPIIEDLALIVPGNIPTQEIIDYLKKQSNLIKEISLLDRFDNTRTFHIVYQNPKSNLTNEEVAEIRKKMLVKLKDKWGIEEKTS
jgi:phenylalanyl-tRNA synthetase beta chain